MSNSIFSTGANIANAAINTGLMASSQRAQSIEDYMKQKARQSMTKKIFEGRIEVLQAANGYIVNIGKKEGYEFETHIAHSVKEVNEIIAAQIVAFRLEV